MQCKFFDDSEAETKLNVSLDWDNSRYGDVWFDIMTLIRRNIHET